MPEPTISLSIGEQLDPAERYWHLFQEGSPPPDVHRYLDQLENVSLSQRVAVLRMDQSRCWQQGREIPVEAYLEHQPEVRATRDAAIELIYGEFLLRRGLGQHPTSEEYLRRFPDLAESIGRFLRFEECLGNLGDESIPEEQLPTRPDGPVEVDRSSGATLVSIGKYRVVQKLGEGGQATVYRAIHPTLQRDVAIKLSHEVLAAEPERDQLLAEGRILAALEHPGLLKVFDIDFHQGRPFLVSEFVRGRTLDRFVTDTPLSPLASARMVARVARALATAHKQGIIHQDVKPSNILIDEAGQPKLIDFGLGRLAHAWAAEVTGPVSIGGSVQYMAPEQGRGEADLIGPRSDVFGLGSVLYFLLVGRPPFPGKTFPEILIRVRKCEWDREGLAGAALPRRLVAICFRALEASPANRYAGASDLAKELERFARPTWKWLAMPALAAALALALLLAGLGWMQGSRPGPSTPREPALLVSQPVMEVRVWRNDRYQDLLPRVPLRTGAELAVFVDLSPGVHATLFLCNAEGKLSVLKSWPAAKLARSLRYPAEASTAANLSGRTGTELLLLCGSTEGPVELAEVREACEPVVKGWPTLPDISVLRLERDRVVDLQRTRDLDRPHHRADPEGEVKRRLEELRIRLKAHFACIVGVAFCHAE